MPVATLTFQLPEESEDFESATSGSAYRAALGDVWNNIRSKTKYSELTDEQYACYDQVRTWIQEACEGYDLEVP